MLRQDAARYPRRLLPTFAAAPRLADDVRPLNSLP
jgi:hypothetical protein